MALKKARAEAVQCVEAHCTCTDAIDIHATNFRWRLRLLNYTLKNLLFQAFLIFWNHEWAFLAQRVTRGYMVNPVAGIRTCEVTFARSKSYPFNDINLNCKCYMSCVPKLTLITFSD
jgi:hypothetical protein